MIGTSILRDYMIDYGEQQVSKEHIKWIRGTVMLIYCAYIV